jgi:hypothetical protein
MLQIRECWASHTVLVREFLTGFHKRKVAKKEAAIKKAKLREKQERLDTRREVCQCSARYFAISRSVIV